MGGCFHFFPAFPGGSRKRAAKAFGRMLPLLPSIPWDGFCTFYQGRRTHRVHWKSRAVTPSGSKKGPFRPPVTASEPPCSWASSAHTAVCKKRRALCGSLMLICQQLSAQYHQLGNSLLWGRRVHIRFLQRNGTNRIYGYRLTVRRLLMLLWRLRSPQMCSQQARDPGELTVYFQSQVWKTENREIRRLNF